MDATRPGREERPPSRWALGVVLALAIGCAAGTGHAAAQMPESSGPAETDMPPLPDGTVLPARPDFEGLSPERRTVAEAVQHRIICYCGGCPKLNPGYCAPGCGTEKVLLAEIRSLVDQGKSVEESVSWFVGKYGEQILSAPPARGFNLVAWIAPFAALLAATIVLLLALRRSARRVPRAAPSSALDAGAPDRLGREWDPFR